MLSNFMRKNGKKKGAKHMRVFQEPHRSIRPPTSPESFESPQIVDIGEQSIYVPRDGTPGPFVQLEISTEPWFPEELLYSRRSSRRSACAPTNVRDAEGLPGDSREDPLRKKSVPAPILIPDPHLDVSGMHDAKPKTPSKAPDPISKDLYLRNPSSPESSENMSAISGTTLARALIANSFILSPCERAQSRHRSGVARQDSATLPPESSVPSLPGAETGRPSSVPSVPPLPPSVVLEQRRAHRFSGTMATRPSVAKSEKGTDRNTSCLSTDSHCTPLPETDMQAGRSRRISSILEAPSAPNTPTSKKCALDAEHQNAMTTSAALEHGAPDSARAASEVVSSPPSSSSIPKTPGFATDSSQADGFQSSTEHSLDEYSFMPPGPHTAMLSPHSDSSASYVAPLPVKRRNSNLRRRLPKPTGAIGGSRNRKDTRGGTPYQRNKKQVRLLPMAESFAQKTLLTPTMMTQTSISHLPLVPSSAVSAGHLEMPPTACDVIQEDYSSFLDYTITISPDPHSSSQYTSTGSSAGYQTFPETPMFSPPLFSPDPRRPPVSSLRTRRQPLPRPATLPSPCSISLPRQTSNTNLRSHKDHGNVCSHRPQSIASPIYGEPSFLLDPSSGISRDPLLRRDDTLPATPSKASLPLTDTIGPSKELIDPDTLVQTVVANKDLGSVILPVKSTSSIQSACKVDACESPISVPPSEPTGASPRLSSSSANLPRTSPLVPSSRHSSSHVKLPPTTSQPQPAREMDVLKPVFCRSFLPSITPTLSPSVPPGPNSSRSSPTARPSSAPISPSFVAPPPCRTVICEETVDPPTGVEHLMLRTSSCSAPEADGRTSPPNYQPRPFGSQTRARPRPPLPIGPRRPSGPTHPFCGRVPGFRARGSSESKVTSAETCGNTHAPAWRKLYEVASQPLPKFQTPPPKWRGLTMEAAQWTLTSAELQSIVSGAMKQFAEGSSIRLLRLETLDGEIAEEIHRLEMLHTDVKSRYKMLVRRRWQLIAELTGHLESGVVGHTANITLAELAEVTLTQDQLADELHTVAEQLAQLEGLRDDHHSSALAMALRKVNTIFLRQAAEMQKLHEQLESLEAERDEGWKQAHDIAVECDRLIEAAGESGPRSSNKRSKRVSAVRKSSMRQSRAGLRPTSTSRRRSASSAQSRGSMSVPSSACKGAVPPVPPLPLHQLDSATNAVSLGSGSLCYSGASTTRALSQAQQELYEMLGLDFQNSPSSARSPDLIRSLANTRPLSDPDMARSLRARRAHENRAVRSVILDDGIATLPLSK